MKHHETTSHPVANVSHFVRVLEQACDFVFAEVYLCKRPASAILSWALHGFQHTVRRTEHARGQRVPNVRLHILLQVFLLFLFRDGALAMNHQAAGTSTRAERRAIRRRPLSLVLQKPLLLVGQICLQLLHPSPSAPPSATVRGGKRSWSHVQLLHHDDRHQRRHSTTRAGWSDQPTLRSRNRVPQRPWRLSSGSAKRRPAVRCGASQLPLCVHRWFR